MTGIQDARGISKRLGEPVHLVVCSRDCKHNFLVFGFNCFRTPHQRKGADMIARIEFVRRKLHNKLNIAADINNVVRFLFCASHAAYPPPGFKQTPS